MAKVEPLKPVESVEPQAEQPELSPLPKTSGKLREHTVVDWIVFLTAWVTKDNLLDPRLWSVVSENMQRFHEITAISVDGLWVAKIMVVNAGKGQRFQAKLLAIHDLPPMDMGGFDELADFTFEQNPQTLRWRVIRKKDKVLMVDHALTREDARRQLLDHATLRN